MSIYLRPRTTGATVFFTVALATRGSTLLVREVDTLRRAVWRTKNARPFAIDTWVVLPDHMHCIWQMPAGDRDYGVRWGAIKARFTRDIREKYANHCRPGFTPAPAPCPERLPTVTSGRYAGVNPGLRRHKGERAIWQRRFWEHHIRNEEDFMAHLRFCWQSPVKLGLVDRPEEWAFSSVHRDPRFMPGSDPSTSRPSRVPRPLSAITSGPAQPSIFNAEIKASCGMSTLPN